ncbi:MAG: FHA domain-containing protein [Planctomycetota bacterium]|nr:FHA domain-containing protein [Planctomycetota bacterium]
MDVKLVMFRTSGQRKDFPITSPLTVIGRGEECGLRVPLPMVSRQHCELSVASDEVKVKDLASSNGTYVNNQRVSEQSIKAGDRLVVGPIVFTVQIDGVPEEIQPVKTKGQLMAEAGKVGGIGGEEVVELEADVVLQPEPAVTSEQPEMDSDPISALEALAAQKEEDQEQ